MADDRAAILVPMRDTDLTLAHSADDVRGRKVIDRNGDEVGDVEDLLIDPDERRVRFLDVGVGGFLGIGERTLLVPVDAVTAVDEDVVRIDQEREYLASAPAYDPELKDRPYFEELYGYYGYPPFWGPDYIRPGFPFR